jgi:catechol 2,3-dioxygenase-like lactoylglutathione lyase family enzyme
MSTPTTDRELAVKFHVCLNVANLERALVFYRALFAVEPLKHHADYAKFELTDPPLVLSLKPISYAHGGTLNHLGFRVPNAEHLVEFQKRLEKAGFRTQRQEGVECCYARQTKFWVADPDSNLWEIYVLHADIDHKGTSHGWSGMKAPLGALGLGGMLRRGLGRARGAVRCWWSRRCSSQPTNLHSAEPSRSEEPSVPATMAERS